MVCSRTLTYQRQGLRCGPAVLHQDVPERVHWVNWHIETNDRRQISAVNFLLIAGRNVDLRALVGAFDTLYMKGTLAVVHAGNEGRSLVGDPGLLTSTLTVGSTTCEDRIYEKSNRGQLWTCMPSGKTSQQRIRTAIRPSYEGRVIRRRTWLGWCCITCRYCLPGQRVCQRGSRGSFSASLSEESLRGARLDRTVVM